MSQPLQPHRFALGKRFTLAHLALTYGVLATLWIVVSVMSGWFHAEDSSPHRFMELATGLPLVAFTSGLLYMLHRSQKKAASLGEERLLHDFHSFPFIGVAVTSPDMREWRQFNDRLCEILDYSAEELRRKSWTEVTHPDDRESDRAELERTLRAEIDGYTAERRFVRGDSSIAFAMVDVRCVRAPDGNADHLVISLQDISDRKKHEAHINQLSQLYVALSQCNHAIMHSSSREQLLPQICEIAVRFGGMRTAWVGMLEASGEILPIAAYGIVLDQLNEARLAMRLNNPSAHDPIALAIRDDSCVWNQDFPDEAQAFHWHERGRQLGWRSMAALPLHQDGKVIGVYVLYAGEALAFGRTAQTLLFEMARNIEYALENFHRDETGRQLERVVRDAEDHFRDLFLNAPLPYQSLDIKGNILEVNSRWLDILGYRREEVIGRFFGDFVAEESDCHPTTEYHRFKTSDKIDGACFEMIRQDGGTRQWLVNVQTVRDIDGNFIRTHCIFTDITDRRKSEEQLQFAVQVFEQSSEGIMMVDAASRIVMVNKAFSQITGFSPEEVLGSNPSVLSSGRHDHVFYRSMWEAVEKQGRWQGEIWNRRKNGNSYPQWLSITRVPDASGKLTHYIGIFSDLTEHKATQEHIHRLAHFDPLTGLPNRILLGERSRMALSMAQRQLEPMALMFIDLDHFKNINDSLGHRIGDGLLVQFAQRLSELVREQDTLSRLGGDEFILVLPSTNVKGASHLAEKLLAAAAEPYHVAGYELGITCSVGIAMFPKDGRDFETLSQSADVAMYRAKQNGRNDYCFFTADMQVRSARVLEMENALRRALERNQLSLHYQPQLSLVDGRIVGVEALIRWHHPKFGAVSPTEFIPLAESSGLIMAIGEWVLRTAIRQMKDWLDKGFEISTVAVNLSAVQFRHPNLTEVVMKALSVSGLAPHHLELELTEGVAMENPVAAIAMMDKLHENGIRMSIDDFGIGHSSLGYLKRFRVNKLKIDRAFVRDIPTDRDDTALVGAVISLASSLGLRTVAEGVENEQQLAFLRSHGCDEIQGHYFSQALPAADMEAFLQINRAAHILC